VQLLAVNLAVPRHRGILLPASSEILDVYIAGEKPSPVLINKYPSPFFPLLPSEQKAEKENRRGVKMWVLLQIYSSDKLVLSSDSFAFL